LNIRPATAHADDYDRLWAVLEPMIREGETYALPVDMDRQAALAYWLAPGNEVFLAELNGAVVGTYFLRENYPGGGAHVGNCGYVVAPRSRGSGVAYAMGEHSLVRARERGFLALQYNYVVSSNERAVKLWERLGFSIIGRSPQAFRHPTSGMIDVFIMHRAL